MQAILLLVGAALAWAGGYTLQRVNLTATRRSHQFVELLPVLRHQASRLFDVANQDPNASPLWTLPDDAWPDIRDANAIYQQAVLSSSTDVQWALRIKNGWFEVATRFDPDYGDLNSQVVGDAKTIAASSGVVSDIDAYSRALEQRFLRKAGLGRLAGPSASNVKGA